MSLFNKILSKETKLRKAQLISVLALTILSIGFEALAPWSFKFLIDNVLENEPIIAGSFVSFLFSLFTTKASLGFFLVFIFFLCKLLFHITSYFRSLIAKRVVHEIVSAFSKKSFENLEMLSMGFYRNKTVGDYIYRLSYDVSALGELIEEGILPFIASLLYVFIITIVLFLINAELAVLSLIALPFLVGSLYILNRRVVVASKKSDYWNSAIFSFMQQIIMQLKVIQAYGQEESELKKFNERMQASLRFSYAMHKYNVLLSLFIGMVIAVSYSLIIGVGVTLVFDGVLSAGLLIVYIFYLDNLTMPLLSVVYSYSIIRESNVKLDKVDEYFDDKNKLKDIGKTDEIKDTKITFKDVTVEGPEGKQILSNVSFIAPEEKITAIVGMSGSGKTTIVSLVLRLFIEPSKGKIYIGEHSLEDYKLKALRNAISFVPQEILLFNRSIRDIISYGKSDATLDEIQEAAKLAVADDFIKKLPGDYNFMVGQDGNYLSLGQRQRLMLARSYIKKAPILILDEVFSSQDTTTRFTILSNFRKVIKNKTVIVVSNELEVISEADNIVVVHNGKIAKTLTHGELLQKRYLKESNLNKLILD
ncbi:MAG: ABC transporter ATP-binding protein [Candidatus Levybacteria bacterium]|nr:ABC transporter ATP-binding protein [Candidatus Levybacteria bacterium]